MKIAVLGNGASRIFFTDPSRYDYIIGCNIPWTEVDANVIIDEEMVNFWYQTRTKYAYHYPTFFSKKAWMKVQDLRAQDYFTPFLKEIVSIYEGVDSSAHVAAKCALKMGAQEINIYGCDSRFTDSIASRTHEYINNKSPNKRITIDMWNREWDAVIERHPEVKITFIGEKL